MRLHFKLIAEVAVSPQQDSYMGVLLYTFALILLLFLLVNLDRRFREYVGRSLVRPFNFFADIRDRRLIPNAQTTILAFVCSGALGIAVATLLRGFSTHPAVRKYFAALLPQALYSPKAGLAWDYAELLIGCTVISFFAVVALSLLLRFCAIFVRGRFYFGDAYNIAVWSVLPASFLLAHDLILPRMDMDQSTAVLSLVLLLAIFVWSYFRVLKGAGVLFDIYPTKIYAYGILVLAIMAVLSFVFLQ